MDMKDRTLSSGQFSGQFSRNKFGSYSIKKIIIDRLVCLKNNFYHCIVKISSTKQKIIETATELFYKNGYNLTGINEIISEAGIAKATLYSHFKSKEDVCVAYLQYKNGTFLSEIEKYCKSQKKGKGQLIAVFDFLLLFFQDKDFNGCWCLRTVSEIPKEKQKIWTEIQLQKRKFLQVIFSLCAENFPKMSKEKIDTLSKQIYLLYESAVSESHLHQDRWPIKTAKKLAKQLF